MPSKLSTEKKPGSCFAETEGKKTTQVVFESKWQTQEGKEGERHLKRSSRWGATIAPFVQGTYENPTAASGH
jgi:hypothetical protein